MPLPAAPLFAVSLALRRCCAAAAASPIVVLLGEYASTFLRLLDFLGEHELLLPVLPVLPMLLVEEEPEPGLGLREEVILSLREAGKGGPAASRLRCLSMSLSVFNGMISSSESFLPCSDRRGVPLSRSFASEDDELVLLKDELFDLPCCSPCSSEDSVVSVISDVAEVFALQAMVLSALPPLASLRDSLFSAEELAAEVLGGRAADAVDEAALWSFTEFSKLLIRCIVRLESRLR